MQQILQRARPVLPTLVVEDVGVALEIAAALHAGGIQVLEVTLRTACALDALAAIRQSFPELLVGAGTLTEPAQFAEVRDAGAHFAVSPGCSERLAGAASDCGLPFLPGVLTPSEVLRALEYGYRALKLFPANGSIQLLESFQAPFAGVSFCPSGGITRYNLPDFLRLPNVACVAGTWVAPESLIRARDWGRISQLASEASSLANSLEQNR
jgi:2-dehydro-3-deoxyphosphogluconate aldolase/(4S)-4-hydroxy-2-oxoglutarate aldolase